MPAPVRHLVLDNEAASALLSTRRSSPKRKHVVVALMAANGRVVVPTAVRCEAGWDRRDATAADANRLVPFDDDLDRAGADRNAELRRVVPSASIVDAAVAVATERLPGGDIVEVLTSDVRHLEELAGYLDRTVDVQRL